MDSALQTITTGPYLFLGVYDTKILVKKNLAPLAAMLQQRFGCETCVLNGGRALAALFSSIPVYFGTEHAGSPVLEQIEAVARSIEIDIGAVTTVPAFVPDSRYHVELYLHKGDLHLLAPFAFLLQSEYINDPHNMELAISFRHQVLSSSKDRVKSIVSQWHREACATGFANQRIEQVPVWFRDKADGFVVAVPCSELITYPAIELYLRCLTDLGMHERPASLCFRNSPQVRTQQRGTERD
jgi:hypothetical protein